MSAHPSTLASDLGFNLEMHTKVGGKYRIQYMRDKRGVLRPATPEEVVLWTALETALMKLGDGDGRRRKRE